MPATNIRLNIVKPDGATRMFEIEPGVYTVGSDDSNRIVLPHGEIAWRQAIISYLADGCWVENLTRQGGVLLAGQPVTGRQQWQPGQRLQVGSYTLYLEGAVAPSAPAAVAPPPAKAPASPVAPPAAPAATPPAAPPAAPEADNRLQAIKRQIHTELLARLDLKRMTASHVDEKELRKNAQRVIQEIVKEVRDRLPPGMDARQLAKDICDEALALGPLEELLADASVTEIMVNGADNIYVERSGKLYKTARHFLNDDSVMAIIERIVAPIGRRIDESQPYVDARLRDGSRVNAIIHPLSLVGPCLTIRKFSKEPFTVQDIINFNTMNKEMAEFIQVSVQMRKNVIVSGGTGSGKTTLLNVISSYLPVDDRIVTIEDAAELRLGQPHVIRLEARPPNIEGKGAITIRDLVRNALRMRPDRIVVGECRGGEALDMLQAMNTGHDGSLTTVHANSPRDVISRLETMVLMSGMDLPVRAIREQIGAAVHLIIHTSRYTDGSRKISKITEVCGMEGDSITMQDIFVFNQTGVSADGRVQGRFEPTGSVPTYVEEMHARGIEINRRIFDPRAWGAS